MGENPVWTIRRTWFRSTQDQLMISDKYFQVKIKLDSKVMPTDSEILK